MGNIWIDNLKIFYMEGKRLELNYNDESFLRQAYAGWYALRQQ